MLPVGKHLGLMRQVRAAGIDEIDAGQPVLAGDLLGAKMLLHRHRVIGAALDGGIVADDHHLAAFDAADPGDDAGAVDRAVIHVVGGERAEFEKRRAGIEQARHPLARQQLAAGQMPLARLGRSALRDGRALGPKFAPQARPRRRGWRARRPEARSADVAMTGTRQLLLDRSAQDAMREISPWRG